MSLVARLLLVALACLGALPAGAADVSDLKGDETLLFYPTAAAFDAERGVWSVPVHGVVFEEEADSLKRAVLLRLLRGALPADLTAEEAKLFDRRARLFLVDHERGKRVVVRLDSQTRVIGTSEPNGHFRATLELPADAVERLRDGVWLTFAAALPKDDSRRFSGRAALIEPTGLSVVSDLDDTIKISEVRDRRALLKNTFLRPFRAVPGMAALYGRLERRGAAFHYVSGSPWQLYPALAAFREEAGFPAGSFHLKQVRLTDSSAGELLGSQEQFKRGAIEEIFGRFPKRRFLLIGDTGEQDPEIYGRLAREHPDQVAGVLLRNVTDEAVGNPRLAKALAGVPAERWRLFSDPQQLDDFVDRLR